MAAGAARVRAVADDGSEITFTATVRVDTPQEVEYYRNGGILPYVLRQLAGEAVSAVAPHSGKPQTVQAFLRRCNGGPIPATL